MTKVKQLSYKNDPFTSMLYSKRLESKTHTVFGGSSAGNSLDNTLKYDNLVKTNKHYFSNVTTWKEEEKN